MFIMQVIPVHVEKEIDSSDNLSDLFLGAASVEEGDVVVVAQKIISKNEGQSIDLSTITPSLNTKKIPALLN